MRAATPNPVQLLAQWLANRPQDFGNAMAMGAIADLLEHAATVREVTVQHRTHMARWALLPEDVRQLACRRQLAALAVRLAMRNGMTQPQAIGWVIALAGMSRDAFKRACADVLRNGDRLLVWQWRELVALGLRDDFLCRRQLARWLELEEPWVTDVRWVCPLHLVDGYAAQPGEAHDAAA